jgi:hypothetical protein
MSCILVSSMCDECFRILPSNTDYYRVLPSVSVTTRSTDIALVYWAMAAYGCFPRPFLDESPVDTSSGVMIL